MLGLLAAATVRAGAVLGSIVVSGLVAGAAWGAQDVLLTTAAAAGELTIDGSIEGVRAGQAAVPLRLTLRNSGAADRHVTRVTTTPTGVADGPATCAAGYLSVGDWTGSVTIAPGAAVTLTVPVAVSAGLPVACRDVTWGLAYAAY